MRRRAAFVGLGALLLASIPAGEADAQGRGAAAVPAVTVAPVITKDVGQTDEFTGRVEAIQSVSLQARVEGYLDDVSFTGGESVKTGTVLFQIDKAPYEASLAQAQAQVASANASLASAEAGLKNAQINLERQQTLLQRNTVAQATVDDATAQRDEAAAKVQSAQAEIEQAKAAVTSAQLNLSYTTISAPIDGRLGKPLVTKGNLVSPASGTMATLIQIDPIRVAFSVPDTLYTDLIQRAGAVSSETTRTLFEPTLQLPNGTTYDKDGDIAFSGNEIDPATGTITAYADFANPDGLLLPGAFVVVTVSESKKSPQPVVPASALLQDRQGPYVFVVNNDDVVEQRRITVASRSTSDVVIQSGLTEGETVIVQGVQKVRPGQKVDPSPLTAAAQQALEGTGVSRADAAPSPDATSTGATAATGAGASDATTPTDATTSTDATTPTDAAASQDGATTPAPTDTTAGDASAGDATADASAGGDSAAGAAQAAAPAGDATTTSAN